MKYITLFDFDGTLTRHDSFTGFIRHVRGLNGLISVLIKSAPAIFLWKTGLRDNTYAKLRMFSAAFRGMPAADFQKFGESYAVKINRMIRPEIKARLNDAVRQGDNKAVIVSASLKDWIMPWAESQGVDAVIATEAEIDSNGILTGAFSTANCQLDEKVKRLVEKFPQLSSSRKDFYITAYGDSDGDNAMLEFADKGIRV